MLSNIKTVKGRLAPATAVFQNPHTTIPTYTPVFLRVLPISVRLLQLLYKLCGLTTCQTKLMPFFTSAALLKMLSQAHNVHFHPFYHLSESAKPLIYHKKDVFSQNEHDKYFYSNDGSGKLQQLN
ncbi:hypothetical protein AQUCO_07600132v1 [Aquilegia coerulea]|uniref:Uncharacterized protein n=1 Tax=Aquilegia coerulea TaxID=218851 RepID=A0A2G5CA75_AQUCA|nr:hypothetical protein AQUCO_07600132v1 [Aquilegia coerulea]